MTLIEWLKDLGKRSNAGSAYVEFTCDDGSIIRLEWKPAEKKGGHYES